MSTLAVVEEILRETEVPMSVRQIVEYANGRLPTKSKTPDTVVARDLSMDIKKKGEASLFIRTAPGRYTIRAIHLQKMREAEEVRQREEVAAEASVAAQPQDGAMVAHDGHPAHAGHPVHEEAPTSVLASAIRADRAGPRPAPRQPATAGEQSSSVTTH